ncbi:hypothetical protein [Lachnoclostridium sp. An76]|uniref:hypothetical protein n=1 Tax=Lachnoclostridium sp. An76 TaxID=1965654 RepID=UPI000B3A6B1C|nr:hypothetical protein [Lachnoclostridium sp. An76]OUN36299.1 hypothetical protein B5G27_03960 [Lachnoclostridium sp. An76]
MIYMVFIIIIFLILITVMATMNAQHGKISERPLRRKILDDTANLLFFTTVFCCLFFFVKEVKIILSLVAILLITLLFIHKARVKKIINIFLIKSTLFTALLRNRQSSSLEACDKNSASNDPNQPAQRQDIYREYILSFVVLFCKRAVLLIVFSLLMIWIVHNFFADQKIVDILKPFSDENFLIDALTLLNNWGFIFNCWKFSSDYQAIQNEKYDAELERIIRKLDRREHDI